MIPDGEKLALVMSKGICIIVEIDEPPSFHVRSPVLTASPLLVVIGGTVV